MPRLESLSLSLPSASPPPSPPATNSRHGPRSVSWSLPSPSARTSFSLPIIRIEHVDQRSPNELSQEDPNSPEFLDWRRLHLSKAKLSGITEIATLMAGFSVVATVELQINDDAHPYLLTAFTVTTALLVCTTMLAIMISTCILPHIIVVAKMAPHSKSHESPHNSMMWYIDTSWILANTVSIFLFTLDVIILCWIKFTYFSQTASICATAIMIPVLLAVCVFGVLFYRNIVKHQYIVSDKKYQELEEMKRSLDHAISIMVSKRLEAAKKLLDRLLPKDDSVKKVKRLPKINPAEVFSLCQIAKQSFLKDPTLLEFDGPVKICGDIHGQYYDLLKIFGHGGSPSENRYLFLGDYVDRGPNSIEVICLLLCLKVVYPQEVFLLRGNHEIRHVNRRFGFYEELTRKYRRQGCHDRIFKRINDVFDNMPYGALINDRIFCCHGGISPELEFDMFFQLERPIERPTGWVKDVLWSDPDRNISQWEKQSDKSNPRHRGAGFLFGRDAVDEFLQRNDVDLICRAHECVREGSEWFFDKKVVTVFSAPNYVRHQNKAAILKIDEDGETDGFIRFR